MTFRFREAARVFGLRSALFSPGACESLLRDEHRLAPEFQAENVFAGFREAALAFFATREIKWHSGVCDRSIVSSQVSCLNCLFPFATDRAALRTWLSKLYPDVEEALPISSQAEPPLPDGSRPLITFEWIGEENYLNEPRWGKRGQGCTSVDAVLRFRKTDGRIQLVLLEWKYCEEAGRQYLHTSAKGTDRTAIYRPHLEPEDCQLDLKDRALTDLMFVPFDQLMRLQLLASAMERRREMDADVVSLLHVAPAANDGLLDPVLSAKLSPARTVGEVWRTLARPDRFHSIASEDLVPLLAHSGADPQWAAYIERRYGAATSPARVPPPPLRAPSAASPTLRARAVASRRALRPPIADPRSGTPRTPSP